MKVIFLDIDGVLNSDIWYQMRSERCEEIDMVTLPYLKWIVVETGAKIVLSSSWRKLGKQNPDYLELLRILDTYGLEIFSETPHHSRYGKWRGNEIMEWIDSRGGEVESIVILDDDSDMCELMPFLVHLNWRKDRGLGKKHAEAAIELLNSNKFKEFYNK